MGVKILKIINEWNPVEIYPLLEDEYCSESKRVMEARRELNSIEELAIEIFGIFKNSFGKEFTNSIEECKVIAEKILKYQ
ncbi:DUF1871 family protein [Paenibacillus ihbetae]|uniref:DUF1871 domain-containing protein n=1 Tax=Paenibacillus ihbetae TaxID=1870820 RepID=A0ABX3JPF4_9BACL|nr:DUF1871 family protein [Paenibacillus ihbetae]OOC58720.1 hypothetical protein BBD40_23850 [Paenibacillus ihbetae]